METIIHFLKASHGDSFIIEDRVQDNNPTIIIIDGGLPDTYRRYINPIIRNFSRIDLVVLTHTDDDHIKGLTSFFQSELYSKIDVKEYWANCRYSIKLNVGSQVSLAAAKDFDNFLLKKEKDEAINKWNKDIIFTGEPYFINDMEFLILSPHKKQINLFYDKWRIKEGSHTVLASNMVENQLQKGSIEYLGGVSFSPTKSIIDDFVNASSIAFLMKCKNLSILFFGDARPEILVMSLKQLGYNSTVNRMTVDYVKISHHGSKNNTSPELLSYIECNHFIISTNGGIGQSKHPDRETIAWILCREKREEETTYLYFNYKLFDIESKAGKFLTSDECEKYNCIVYENVERIPYEK